MQPLNAVEAITPAFTRTRQVLFQPFRFGRTWKLAACAYVAKAGGVFIPFPLFLILFPLPVTQQQHLWIVAAAIILLVVMFLIFYLCSRLQFVAFDIVVTGQQQVAPIWRRYAGVSWPWTWLKVLLGTVVTLAIAPILYRLIKSFIATAQAAQPNTQPNPDLFFAIFGFYLLLFAFYILLLFVSSLLGDFVLPFIALDRISIFAAMRSGFRIFVADPLQFLAYLGMKIVLAIAAYMAAYAATLAVIIPIYIVVFVGIFTTSVVHHSSAIATVLAVVAGVVVFLGIFFAFFYVTFAAYGAALTFLEAYAVYFLGGRYPRLGEMLDPTPGKPYTPPPIFPGPDEPGSGSGPALPMNPIPA